MRVLLLGNYSGLGIALKEGLIRNGVDVTLITNGDGWKKMPGADDILFPVGATSIIKKIQNYIIYPSTCKKFRGYDIVQAPGTNIFYWGAGTAPFENVIKNNGKFFINAAGVDYYLYQSWKKKRLKYQYYMYDNNPELCSESNGNSLASVLMNYRCKRVMKKADGIIPVIPYEYEISYSSFPNLKPVIPLPINTDQILYREQSNHGKLVLFHGINRIKDKGSEYIRDAMSKLQNNYPNDVECIIADRMPYAEYVECLNRANVVIDQCKSYGYGINACMSMAMGKIVMSGAEDEVNKYFNFECPIINIRPDVDYIYDRLISLLDDKKNITEIGIMSRRFVEKYHNYIKIAKQYLDIWCD